jgi:hypothetical protein
LRTWLCFYAVLCVIAAVRAVEGNVEEACTWLRKSMERGWAGHHLTTIDPLFENLRDEEEFRQIMAEMREKLDGMRGRAEKAEERAD